ncbi:MAG TPA: hypothetical protein VMG40_13810 [Bryobacteraceae bacterium]|nr:hypothetical protein [Bryobacteraceae bacterium]
MNGSTAKRSVMLALAALLAVIGMAIFARAWLGHSPLIPTRTVLNLEGFFALAAIILVTLGAHGADRSASTAWSRRDLALASLVAVLAIGAFASTRGFYFVSDDFLTLDHAQAHFSLAWLRQLLTTPGGDGHFGPLVYLFNLLCWRRFHADYAAWHWVGYAIHAVNCVLVYALASALGYAMRARMLASALFAIHGSRPEPVVWITAHFDLLSTFCVLAALVCLLRGLASSRRAIYFAAMLLFMVAGMLSKEAAFACPFLALLLIATRSKNARREIPIAAAICAVAAAVFMYRWILFGGIGGYLDASGRPQFLSLTPLVVVKSLGLRLWSSLFFPLNWSVPVGKFLAVAMAVYVAALTALFFSAAISRRRVIETVGFTFFAALPIVSRLLIPADAEGSRILYLPSIGLCLLAGTLIENLRRKAAYTAAAAILIFHADALQHNLLPWAAASATVRQTCQAVATCKRPAAKVIGLPRKIDGAYTFANGFAECVAMQPGAQVRVDENSQDACVFTWDESAKTVRQLTR